MKREEVSTVWGVTCAMAVSVPWQSGYHLLRRGMRSCRWKRRESVSDKEEVMCEQTMETLARR